MVATLICPTSCGFARVAALEIVRETTKTLRRENGEGTAKFRARSMQECYKRFNKVFEDRSEQFAIEFLKFQKKIPALREMFSSWNPRKKDEKEKYVEKFSIQNWEKMPPALKTEHSFANCKGCYHRYPEIQALLPVKSNQFVGLAKENPCFIASKEAKIKPCKAGEAKEIARALYNKIDASFQKVCSISFGEALTKLPELQLQKRKSPTEVKRDRRAAYRNFKQKVEGEWEKTSLLR